MFSIARKEISRLVPVVAALIAFATGAMIVADHSVKEMHHTHAKFVSEEFLHRVIAHAGGPNELFSLSVSSETALELLADLKLVGSVYSYRLYDLRGHVRFDSNWVNQVQFTPPENKIGPAQAQNLIAAGEAVISLKRGDESQEGEPQTEPTYFSHNFLPVERDGLAKGLIETYVDESVAWPGILNSFNSTAMAIILLFAAAASIPLWLYLKRAGQLEFVAKKLRYSSEYDQLTGILNRSAFYEQAENMMAEVDSRAMYDGLAVHIVDVARFKRVNERYGHAVGDEVLRRIARRLKHIFGTRELFGRIGGDSFAVAHYLRHGETEEARQVAAKMYDVLRRTYKTANIEIETGVSIGFASSPKHGATVSHLVRAAEVAVDYAKRAERTRIVAFSPSLASQREQRQRLEILIADAVRDEAFELHYQPYFASDTRETIGFEALLRLRSPDGGYISPALFIPIAEEMGLISEIGDCVLKKACATAAKWPEHLKVSVNMSPLQFSEGFAVSAVETALRETGLSPSRLEIEITEGVLIADEASVIADLEKMKALGIAIALDDFGTGYSSLSYLWKFPFDKLKVDKSLIDTIGQADSKSREVLATIVAMAQVLNLQVTAEGVEIEAQAETLRELDCDILQGFLFSRPLNQTDLAAHLKSVQAISKLKSIRSKKANGRRVA